jgi:ABC-type nitrate/sulfonate/bicarbonate transport system substrate-binding protein
MMKIVFLKLRRSLLLQIAMSALFFCTTALAAPQKVSLQFFGNNPFEFAGYYAAVEKDLYKEAGLDIKISEHQTGMDVNDEISLGRAESGNVSSSRLLLTLQENREPGRFCQKIQGGG